MTLESTSPEKKEAAIENENQASPPEAASPHAEPSNDAEAPPHQPEQDKEATSEAATTNNSSADEESPEDKARNPKVTVLASKTQETAEGPSPSQASSGLTPPTPSPKGASGNQSQEKPKSKSLPIPLLFKNPKPKRGPNRFEKTVLKDIARPPQGRLSVLMITAWATVFLAFLQYATVYIPHISDFPQWAEALWYQMPLSQFETYPYHFQLPAAVFIGAFLGPIYGTLAILLYIGISLAGVPLLANGGGTEAVQFATFGYIVGMIIGACYTGIEFKKFTRRFPVSEWRMIKAISAGFFGILLIHLIGSIWLGVDSINQGQPMSRVLDNILFLSGYPLPYDLVIAAVSMAFVRILRSTFWLVMY